MSALLFLGYLVGLFVAGTVESGPGNRLVK